MQRIRSKRKLLAERIAGFERNSMQSGRMNLAYYIAGGVLACAAVLFGLFFMVRLLQDGLVPLASAIGAATIFVVLAFSRRACTPWRWLSLAIVLVLIFTIYPIISTVIISFSNMSGGHLLTKEQAIRRLESKTWLPSNAKTYTWDAYTNGGDYLLGFRDDSGAYFLGRPNRQIAPYSGASGLPDEIPNEGQAYRRMTLRDKVAQIQVLGSFVFLNGTNSIAIRSPGSAAEFRQKYTYVSGAIIDEETGVRYEPVDGTFTSQSGEELIPGFKRYIGLRNYNRFLGNKGYLITIPRLILWNILFAFFSVAISFALGLLIALTFENVPGHTLIRTLLIVPYPVPVLVSIVVWRGLLNESMGLVTRFIENLGFDAPHFFTDRTAARIALILINVYLSYPYFYIIISGALRSIPGEIFDAAAIDGAGAWSKTRRITLPIVLQILSPLLIASFSFNFNNFTLIWGFNAGLPPMPDSIVPMGYTDLLISFVYRLGFSTANASNYGFAAAITVLLFAFVAIMAAIQMRATKALLNAEP